MLKNYLLSAIRNIKRDLFYSGINIIGLAIGMSCSILIMLWVYDEVSYDRFHEDSSLIYRIIARLPQTHIAVGPMPLAKSLKEEYPEIQESVNLNFNNDVELRVDEIILKDNIGLYTSSEFFKIFNIKIIKKQTDSLLSNTNEIILTQSLAQKIFGNENPIGKSITVNINKEYMVSAIVEDYPANSHFEFDFIVDIFSNDHLKASEDNWGTFMCFPYIKINNETNIDTLRKKVEYHFNKIYGEETKAGTIGLQSLEDIHLKSSHLQELYATLGDIKYVKIFTLVSIFILIIACINFMNLSTAKAAKRLTDVGIRKVVGARRGQLIAQYLGESLFIALIAMLFALLFVDFMLPVFNTISQKNITMEVFSFKEIIWLVFITIITGLISGSYTAIYLSGIKSTQILSKEPIRGKSGKYFKQALVITQFTISIALIIISLIVKNQLHYIQNKNLGYKIENQLVIDLGGDFTKDFTNIKAKLLENPVVKNVTSSSSLPVNIIQGTYGGDWPGKDPESTNLINTCEVDHEFINTLELELIEGRNFSPILNVDTGSYIINESALKLMNLEDPIGTEITVARKTAKIIGVIKDFHFTSMHSSIGPLVISRVESSDFLILKIDTKNIQSTIQDINKRISDNFPNYSFSYRTLTDQYNELYTNEQRIGKMFNYFAILAILLSCLGLFGLSAYSAEQRTKEIGIRKALGGSISSIVFILEREFIKWVVISNVIAWPAAYYFAKNWLESFTYKIEISVYLFAIAMIVTFIVAVLTVLFQAYRAASKNPTESLRYE